MAENLERAEDRLHNIQTVEPILSALRTISHSSWQSSRWKLRELRQYRQRLLDLIAYILPTIKRLSLNSREIIHNNNRRVIVLLVGSERGLCGRFHIELANHLESYRQRKQAEGMEVETWVLGSRMKRRLEQRGQPMAWFRSSSPSGLPDFNQTFQWLRLLLSEYEKGEIESVQLIHNASKSGGRVYPQIVQLIPPPLSEWRVEAPQLAWPPPIIETDPVTLYFRLIEQHLATQFLQSLLESAEAEHSTRFHLMEEATKNAERLMDELNNLVQFSRRQAITQEMQELAVGSGLLKADR